MDHWSATESPFMGARRNHGPGRANQIRNASPFGYKLQCQAGLTALSLIAC